MSWFRVPLDIAKSLNGEHKATRHEAVVDLLGRWHLGADPGPRELMRAWDWSADRIARLVREMHAWAKAEGATYPARLDAEAQKATGQNRTGTGQDRTATGQVNIDGRPIVEAPSDSDRTKPDSDRTPRGRADQKEEERREERREDPIPQDNARAPSPPVPTADPTPKTAPPSPAAPPTPAETPPDPSIAIPGGAERGDGALQPPPTKPDGAPTWVPPRAECGGWDRFAIAQMVLDVLAQIRAPADARPEDAPIPVLPEKCHTDAPVVLGLWKADGRRDPAEFARDLVLVARAARWCPAPMFAREIRAEGWVGGEDRSRKVGNVCRRRPPENSSGATWDERLAAAREWEQGGMPTASTALVPATGPPPRSRVGTASAVSDEMARLTERILDQPPPRRVIDIRSAQ